MCTCIQSLHCALLFTGSSQASELNEGKGLAASLFGDPSGSDSDSEGGDLEEIYSSSSNECIITGVSDPDPPHILPPSNLSEGILESRVLMSGDVTQSLEIQKNSTISLSPDDGDSCLLTSDDGDPLVQSPQQSPFSDTGSAKAVTESKAQKSFLSMEECTEAGFESYIGGSASKLDQTTGQLHPSSDFTHTSTMESYATTREDATTFNPLKKAFNFLKQQVLPQKPPFEPSQKIFISQPPQPTQWNTQQKGPPNDFEKAFSIAAEAIKEVDNSRGTSSTFALPKLPEQDTKPVLTVHPVRQDIKPAATPSTHSMRQRSVPVLASAGPSAYPARQDTKPVLTSAGPSAHPVRQDTKPVLTSSGPSAHPLRQPGLISAGSSLHPVKQDIKPVVTSAGPSAHPVRQDTKPVLISADPPSYPVTQDTKPVLSSAGPSVHPVRQDTKPVVKARKRVRASMLNSESEKLTTSEQDTSHYVNVGSQMSTSPKQKQAKLVQKKYNSMKKRNSSGDASKGVSPGKKGKRGSSSPNKNTKRGQLVGKSAASSVYDTLTSSESAVLADSAAVGSFPSQGNKFEPSDAARLNAELSSQRCVLAPIQNAAFSDSTATPPSLLAQTLDRSQDSGDRQESTNISTMTSIDLSNMIPLHTSSPAEPSKKMQGGSKSTLGSTPSLGEGLSKKQFDALPCLSWLQQNSAATLLQAIPTTVPSAIQLASVTPKQLPMLRQSLACSSVALPTSLSTHSTSSALRTDVDLSSVSFQKNPTHNSSEKHGRQIAQPALSTNSGHKSAPKKHVVAKKQVTTNSALFAGTAPSTGPDVSITAQGHSATGSSSKQELHSMGARPSVYVTAQKQSTSEKHSTPAMNTLTAVPVTVQNQSNSAKQIVYAISAEKPPTKGHDVPVIVQNQSSSAKQIARATPARKTPTTGPDVSVTVQKQSNSAKHGLPILSSTHIPSSALSTASGMSYTQKQPSTSAKHGLPTASSTSTLQGNLHTSGTHRHKKSSLDLLNKTYVVSTHKNTRDVTAHSIPEVASTSTSASSSTSVPVSAAVGGFSVFCPAPRRAPTRPSTLSISNTTQQQGPQITTYSGSVSLHSQAVSGVKSKAQSLGSSGICSCSPATAPMANSQPLNNRIQVSAGSRTVAPVVPNSQPLQSYSHTFVQAETTAIPMQSVSHTSRNAAVPLPSSQPVSSRTQVSAGLQSAIAPMPSSQLVSGRIQVSSSSSNAAARLPSSQPVSGITHVSAVSQSDATPMPSGRSQVPSSSRNTAAPLRSSQPVGGIRVSQSAATPMPSSLPVSGASGGLPGRSYSGSSGTGWIESPDAASCDSVLSSSQPAETPGNCCFVPINFC